METTELVRIGTGDFAELAALHRAYKEVIGEDAPGEEDMAALRRAIGEERILFFGARRNGRLVGCCSVSRVFSTFRYGPAGVFEDFYIQPEYRHQGIARALARFAFAESRVGSMTVGCADCDRDMYAAIGFRIPLGNLLAYDESE